MIAPIGKIKQSQSFRVRGLFLLPPCCPPLNQLQLTPGVPFLASHVQAPVSESSCPTVSAALSGLRRPRRGRPLSSYGPCTLRF